MPHSAFEVWSFPMTLCALETFRDSINACAAVCSTKLYEALVPRWPTPYMVVAAWDSSSFGIYVAAGSSSGKRPSFAGQFY